MRKTSTAEMTAAPLPGAPSRRQARVNFCPTKHELAAILRGTAPAAVLRHVRRCETCWNHLGHEDFDRLWNSASLRVSEDEKNLIVETVLTGLRPPQ